MNPNMGTTGIPDRRRQRLPVRVFRVLSDVRYTVIITALVLVLNTDLFLDGAIFVSLLERRASTDFLPLLLLQSIGGNLVHWTPGHLLTDLTAFVLLGCMFERLGRNEFVLAFFLSAVATGCLVFQAHPEFTVYRGLSGVNHGLLAWGILASLREGNRDMILLGLAVFAKILYETWTVTLVLPTHTTFAVPFASASHALGALGGLIAMWADVGRSKSIDDFWDSK